MFAKIFRQTRFRIVLFVKKSALSIYRVMCDLYPAAERLVVRGFLGSVIVEIPVKEVRDEMIENIDIILAKR